MKLPDPAEFGRPRESSCGPGLVSVCLFRNELQLARLRVRYLENDVPVHLFVEADHTHAGAPRTYQLAESDFNSDRCKIILARMTVPAEVLETSDRWAIEEYCRQYSVQLARELFPLATLLVGDVDELPSRDQVRHIGQAISRSPIVTIPMTMSYAKVDLLVSSGRAVWTRTKALRSGPIDPGFRFRRGRRVFGKPGQHFRYLGYLLADTAQKHRDYAHAEHDVGRRHELVQDLAEEYQLSVTPEFVSRGTGLLKHVKTRDLTEPARFLLTCRPDWGSEFASAAPWWRRFVASFLLFNQYDERMKDDAEARAPGVAMLPRALITKGLSLLGFHLVMRVIGRILSQRKLLPPGRSRIDWLRGVNRHGMFPRVSVDVLGEAERLRQTFVPLTKKDLRV